MKKAKKWILLAVIAAVVVGVFVSPLDLHFVGKERFYKLYNRPMKQERTTLEVI